jgi:hypothetical protein
MAVTDQFHTETALLSGEAPSWAIYRRFNGPQVRYGQVGEKEISSSVQNQATMISC